MLIPPSPSGSERASASTAIAPACTTGADMVRERALERLDARPCHSHATCISGALRADCYGSLSLSSTPQHVFTAGAMSSDPTAGMY
jgi:hypothetical protein